MHPKGYIILGSFAALTGAVMAIAGGLDGAAYWIGIGGGLLVGKGYGVWEERDRWIAAQIPHRNNRNQLKQT